jgi:tetratricopeptide (TPR) repeat protein
LLSALFLILISFLGRPVQAQLGFDLKVDKPKPYEDRVLKAEKSTDKPLGKPKRFFQNLTTHYNYFFNASNKLNEVIDGAKGSFHDDYTTLLPFYNYTLDVTAQNMTQLDSVIYKSQTGIVMHDLRNDWIDNLYLLWGAAWYFEKKFDSAALMFQFINYSFAEKEKDGYYRYIGSRLDGNNALSVSTKENRSFPKNLVTPPSRNVAFIWQIRTLIEMNNLAQAGSLIATLRNDPMFPKRLDNDLEEVQAYWFYKQNIWDSAAYHLSGALGQAKNNQEKARWEYLSAQLFEKAHRTEDAEKMYNKAIAHTADPVMDIYARLNLVRLNKSGGENYIDKNIAELLKMAHRDKYADYRDIIYFMAAQMELERNNLAAAQELLLKGAKYNNGNLSSRNKSYLLIADLSYDQKKYRQASAFYDSVQLRDLEPMDADRIGSRKSALIKVVAYYNSIAREDSLQRIAAMPEEERTAYINRLVKQLRRQAGLDEVPVPGNAPLVNVNAPPDLFPSQQPRGEWYFYNNTLKTQGAVQFKQVWGNRPNADNWRRFADVNQQLLTKVPTNSRDASKAADVNVALDNSPSFAALVNNLPLTDVKVQASNDSVRRSLFGLATTFMNEMEDYASAIDAFEQIRKRFPNNPDNNEVLFDLYFAYKKTGNEAKAEEIKKLLMTQGPNSRFATIIATGKDPAVADNKIEESTKAYESIYDLFIEGRFDEAENAKRNADSIYKTNYWQPQLLYIEAVYNIRRHNDSLAKNVLQTLIAQNPDGPLGIKAKTMIDVLNRRSQIEDELTRLQIERPKEDTVAVQQPPVVKNPPTSVVMIPPTRRDTTVISQPKKDVVNAPKPKLPTDTTMRKPVVKPPPASVYKFEPDMKHQVMIILDKVDPMFVNEVKNAFSRYNSEKFYNQTFNLSISDLDADRKLLLIGDFNSALEAIEYLQRVKRLAPTEIIPWLKADKYSFTIMTPFNLNILQEKKDMKQYQQFLDQNLPGKF